MGSGSTRWFLMLVVVFITVAAPACHAQVDVTIHPNSPSHLVDRNIHMLTITGTMTEADIVIENSKVAGVVVTGWLTSGSSLRFVNCDIGILSNGTLKYTFIMTGSVTNASQVIFENSTVVHPVGYLTQTTALEFQGSFEGGSILAFRNTSVRGVTIDYRNTDKAYATGLLTARNVLSGSRLVVSGCRFNLSLPLSQTVSLISVWNLIGSVANVSGNVLGLTGYNGQATAISINPASGSGGRSTITVSNNVGDINQMKTDAISQTYLTTTARLFLAAGFGYVPYDPGYDLVMAGNRIEAGASIAILAHFTPSNQTKVVIEGNTMLASERTLRYYALFFPSYRQVTVADVRLVFRNNTCAPTPGGRNSRPMQMWVVPVELEMANSTIVIDRNVFESVTTLQIVNTFFSQYRPALTAGANLTVTANVASFRSAYVSNSFHAPTVTIAAMVGGSSATVSRNVFDLRNARPTREHTAILIPTYLLNGSAFVADSNTVTAPYLYSTHVTFLRFQDFSKDYAPALPRGLIEPSFASGSASITRNSGSCSNSNIKWIAGAANYLANIVIEGNVFGDNCGASRPFVLPTVPLHVTAGTLRFIGNQLVRPPTSAVEDAVLLTNAAGLGLQGRVASYTRLTIADNVMECVVPPRNPPPPPPVPGSFEPTPPPPTGTASPAAAAGLPWTPAVSLSMAATYRLTFTNNSLSCRFTAETTFTPNAVWLHDFNTTFAATISDNALTLSLANGAATAFTNAFATDVPAGSFAFSDNMVNALTLFNASKLGGATVAVQSQCDYVNGQRVTSMIPGTVLTCTAPRPTDLPRFPSGNAAVVPTPAPYWIPTPLPTPAPPTLPAHWDAPNATGSVQRKFFSVDAYVIEDPAIVTLSSCTIGALTIFGRVSSATRIRISDCAIGSMDVKSHLAYNSSFTMERGAVTAATFWGNIDGGATVTVNGTRSSLVVMSRYTTDPAYNFRGAVTGSASILIEGVNAAHDIQPALYGYIPPRTRLFAFVSIGGGANVTVANSYLEINGGSTTSAIAIEGSVYGAGTVFAVAHNIINVSGILGNTSVVDFSAGSAYGTDLANVNQGASLLIKSNTVGLSRRTSSSYRYSEPAFALAVDASVQGRGSSVTVQGNTASCADRGAVFGYRAFGVWDHGAVLVSENLLTMSMLGGDDGTTLFHVPNYIAGGASVTLTRNTVADDDTARIAFIAHPQSGSRLLIDGNTAQPANADVTVTKAELLRLVQLPPYRYNSRLKFVTPTATGGSSITVSGNAALKSMTTAVETYGGALIDSSFALMGNRIPTSGGVPVADAGIVRLPARVFGVNASLTVSGNTLGLLKAPISPDVLTPLLLFVPTDDDQYTEGGAPSPDFALMALGSILIENNTVLCGSPTVQPASGSASAATWTTTTADPSLIFGDGIDANVVVRGNTIAGGARSRLSAVRIVTSTAASSIAVLDNSIDILGALHARGVWVQATDNTSLLIARNTINVTFDDGINGVRPLPWRSVVRYSPVLAHGVQVDVVPGPTAAPETENPWTASWPPRPTIPPTSPPTRPTERPISSWVPPTATGGPFTRLPIPTDPQPPPTSPTPAPRRRAYTAELSVVGNVIAVVSETNLGTVSGVDTQLMTANRMSRPVHVNVRGNTILVNKTVAGYAWRHLGGGLTGSALVFAGNSFRLVGCSGNGSVVFMTAGAGGYLSSAAVSVSSNTATLAFSSATFTRSYWLLSFNVVPTTDITVSANLLASSQQSIAAMVALKVTGFNGRAAAAVNSYRNSIDASLLVTTVNRDRPVKTTCDRLGGTPVDRSNAESAGASNIVFIPCPGNTKRALVKFQVNLRNATDPSAASSEFDANAFAIALEAALGLAPGSVSVRSGSSLEGSAGGAVVVSFSDEADAQSALQMSATEQSYLGITTMGAATEAPDAGPGSDGDGSGDGFPMVAVYATAGIIGLVLIVGLCGIMVFRSKARAARSAMDTATLYGDNRGGGGGRSTLTQPMSSAAGNGHVAWGEPSQPTATLAPPTRHGGGLPQVRGGRVTTNQLSMFDRHPVQPPARTPAAGVSAL